MSLFAGLGWRFNRPVSRMTRMRVPHREVGLMVPSLLSCLVAEA